MVPFDGVDVIPCPVMKLDWQSPQGERHPQKRPTVATRDVVSSRSDGRPSLRWSGIERPFGLCSEPISIAEAVEGCPAHPTVDERRCEASLATSARASRGEEVSPATEPRQGPQIATAQLRGLALSIVLSMAEDALSAPRKPERLTRAGESGVGRRKRPLIGHLAARTGRQRFSVSTVRG